MTPRTRSVLASALLLVIGAGAGVGLDHLVLLHMLHRTPHAPAGAAHTTMLLGELDKVLHLTPAQHDTIGAILVLHQKAIDSAWQMIHHRVDASMDSVHQEVARILSPDQMTLLREWLMSQHAMGP